MKKEKNKKEIINHITAQNINNNENVGAGPVSAQKTKNKLQTNVGARWYATQNAITLISLVITIIILLILAAVAINLTLGDEGIFKLASNSVEKYENSAQKEEHDLAQVSDYISSSRNSGYTITKLGEATGTNPIAIDATKYDSIYVEVEEGNNSAWWSQLTPTAVLNEEYKNYQESAAYSGVGYWCVIQISKTNVQIPSVRKSNVDITSSTKVTVYGINY